MSCFLVKYLKNQNSIATPKVLSKTSSISAKPLLVIYCKHSTQVIKRMNAGKRNFAFLSFSDKIPKNPKGIKTKIFPKILMIKY